MMTLEEGYIFQGERYSSYYQLEKVMDIPRKTIQYRHETIGLDLDDVPGYEPLPPIERLGKKTYFPEKKSKNNDDELNKIIEYPKAPDFFIDSSEERTEERKREYTSWLMEAPETLLKRELRINEKDLQELLNEEAKEYFYASTYHEDEKEKTRTAIDVIQQVIKEREIED